MYAEGSPSELLQRIVDRLHQADDQDTAAVELGAGSLEDLLRHHERELWPEIEQLARSDQVFRRALRSVWAYSSPMFKARKELLGELGEWRSTWVRFVVEPAHLDDDSTLEWRALELEGSVPPQQLAPLLRSIADWADRQTEP